MGVPDVNERVKEVPARGLRAMFAGIGQMLSVRDKLRGKPGASPEPEADGGETATSVAASPQAVAAEPAATETAVAETAVAEAAAAEAAAEAAIAEAVAQESVVPEAAAPEPVAAAAPEPVAEPVAAAAPEPVAAEAEVAEPATIAEAAPSEAELPLPNYDSLTIASLRARLRNLSADQLTQLIEYEKGHAGRADVIAMFERRIGKLAEG
jgi:hypothetical protein